MPTLMRALVTGGAGFIGSNLVDALLERGDDVEVIDDLSTGRRSNLPADAVLHEADLRDTGRISEVVAAARPEVIFHLGAQIDVRRAVAEPSLDARINVEGTVGVLEAARAAGVLRVVNSSTGGAIYGDTERIPTDEQTVPAPVAPYGQSKHAAEGYCALYTRLHGLSTISLRYANVYGPRQDPHGEGGVIAIFCGKLAGGGRPRIFGGGTQTRDYVYVGDVVAANLAAAGADETAPCNVGTGVETSLLELVEILGALADGRPFEPEFAPARLGEIERSAIDPSRARERLGWEPKVALAEGLRLTLATL